MVQLQGVVVEPVLVGNIYMSSLPNYRLLSAFVFYTKLLIPFSEE